MDFDKNFKRRLSKKLESNTIVRLKVFLKPNLKDGYLARIISKTPPDHLPFSLCQSKNAWNDLLRKVSHEFQALCDIRVQEMLKQVPRIIKK